MSVGYVGWMDGRKLDMFSDTPLFEQLAAVLREMIRSGELKHLDPLPSETRLSQEYGISRDTVRKAIGTLVDEGAAFTVRRRGTFVGPRPDPRD